MNPTNEGILELANDADQELDAIIRHLKDLLRKLLKARRERLLHPPETDRPRRTRDYTKDPYQPPWIHGRNAGLDFDDPSMHPPDDPNREYENDPDPTDTTLPGDTNTTLSGSPTDPWWTGG